VATEPELKQRQREGSARVGRVLRELRQQAGLRQADVAEKLERPQQYVQKFESGGQRLDLWELQQVCRAIGVSLSAMVREFESTR
jgi:transcriptional regulator with XRE-family HTH domain